MKQSSAVHYHEYADITSSPIGAKESDVDGTAPEGAEAGQSKSESGFDLPFKIVLVVAHMGMGGSQRVMSILANNWVSQGHQVDLIRLYDRPVHFPLHQDIRCTCLEKAVRRRMSLT